jgi:tripartite-type tricarboxylate transporter receptor subunit TctC
MKAILAATLTAIAALWGVPANAQSSDYPNKPIRIVVPFAPGGGTDLTARIVGDALSKAWGQSVIVDNRPGASSQIGIDFVAKSPPDGYTLLWASSDGISILPAVKPTVPYKIPDGFEFVSTFAAYPLILAVNAKLPIKNMKEFVEYAKAHPGQMNYSSSGAGGGGHLLPAYIAKEIGVEMNHVPYDSGAQTVVAVAGGHADFGTAAPSSTAPYVEGGTVRAIATTGKGRTTLLPNVPTMAEEGYPQFTEDLFYGMFAPAGTPADIVAKLRDGVQAVLKQQATVDRLHTMGLEPLGLTGNDYRQFVVNDLKRWGDIAKAIDFKLR